jgi:hypothetical protein
MTFTNASPGVATDGESGLPADLEHVHGMPASWPSAWAPAVVALTDAATIAVNAALGNVFRVTLGGNRTLGAPTNPVDGQEVNFEITQDGTGSRTLAYASAYEFSTTIASPTLSTAAGDVDMLSFRYSAVNSKWRCTRVVLGSAS